LKFVFIFHIRSSSFLFEEINLRDECNLYSTGKTILRVWHNCETFIDSSLYFYVFRYLCWSISVQICCISRMHTTINVQNQLRRILNSMCLSYIFILFNGNRLMKREAWYQIFWRDYVKMLKSVLNFAVLLCAWNVGQIYLFLTSAKIFSWIFHVCMKIMFLIWGIQMRNFGRVACLSYWSHILSKHLNISKRASLLLLGVWSGGSQKKFRGGTPKILPDCTPGSGRFLEFSFLGVGGWVDSTIPMDTHMGLTCWWKFYSQPSLLYAE